MERRVWQVVFGFLICCFLSAAIFLFSPADVRGIVIQSSAGAGEPASEGPLSSDGTVYLPVIFNNYSPELEITLEPEDLIIDSLAEDTADRWILNLTAGDAISVTVAPGNTADIAFSIFDTDGLTLVDQHNLSPAGEVETITDLSIEKTGEHDLWIQTAQGEPTDYALMFMDQYSYSFVFRGTLQDSDLREGSLPQNVDHFWFFNATAGQTVSFTITPDKHGDAFVDLRNPEGSRLLTIDDNLVGEPESLENFILPQSGLYGIQVGEFDFMEMDYQIAISLP